MKVYLLTYNESDNHGDYDSRYTVGIYATREQAVGKIALDALEGNGTKQAEISGHFVVGLNDD